jgi:hypothetical protein
VDVPGCPELGTVTGFESMKPPVEPFIAPTQPVIVTVCALVDDAVVCVLG